MTLNTWSTVKFKAPRRARFKVNFFHRRRLSGRSWEDVEIEAYTYMLPRGATVTKG